MGSQYTAEFKREASRVCEQHGTRVDSEKLEIVIKNILKKTGLK